ncbi:DUF2946 family protein [Pseudoxanthomonas indica]|nr:DUF2946 family protein [Pseudoxanthomonas indica]GGD32400.1 hypothetical protein GCM10007235_00390 [Pseudoxanthomonas indica]
MIRHRALHRTFAGLALAAALLMVFAPAMNRLLASASPQLLNGLTELCTVSGLKLVDLSGLEAKGASPVQTVMADCPYCVLLGPVLLSLIVLAACLFPRRVDLAPQWRDRLAPWPAPPPRGLGSRGPPLVL